LSSPRAISLSDWLTKLAGDRLYEPYGTSLPLEWAEVAALRLPQGDDARPRALAARELGARLLEPADRALVSEYVRSMVYRRQPKPARK
jgi:hypothetical protein